MPALLARSVVALAALLALATVAAPAAGAHAGDVDRATNYRTEITGTPDLPGLSVALADAGRTIEVTYTGPGEVVVRGYADEPYLRIGSGGVLENRQSPASYLNASLTADVVVPEEVDAHAAPEWVHVGDRPTARWHDHRAHWMGVADPPAVAAEPHRRHVVVSGWRIPLDVRGAGAVGGEDAAITGNILWVPGPRPIGWLVTLVPAALLLGWLAARRPAALAAAGLGSAVCGLAALGLALGGSPVAPPGWWTASVAVASIGSAVAAVRARRARVLDVALAGGCGLLLGAAVGWVDRTWLVRSSLPVDVPAWVARGVVAATLVLGGTLALAAVVRLVGRRQPMRPLWPPSTGRIAPVTNADSSEAR